MEQGKLLLDERFLKEAVELISKAEKRIYITTFKAEITTKPRGRALAAFFALVCEKATLGVDTRLILNIVSKTGSVPITNRYAMQELPKQGVPVRYLPNNRICHAKIIIVDDIAAIIGSHNLSVKSCHNNFEVSYILQDSYLVGQLIGIFEGMWEQAKGG